MRTRKISSFISIQNSFSILEIPVNLINWNKLRFVFLICLYTVRYNYKLFKLWLYNFIHTPVRILSNEAFSRFAIPLHYLILFNRIVHGAFGKSRKLTPVWTTMLIVIGIVMAIITLGLWKYIVSFFYFYFFLLIFIYFIYYNSYLFYNV